MMGSGVLNVAAPRLDRIQPRHLGHCSPDYGASCLCSAMASVLDHSYLQKPFTSQELLLKVKQASSAKPSAATD
jgi:hypothetical protein